MRVMAATDIFEKLSIDTNQLMEEDEEPMEKDDPTEEEEFESEDKTEEDNKEDPE